LIGLLNDLNALKAYMKQDGFSVRYSEHRQGKKGTTVPITDSQGRLHNLPIRWYKKAGHPAGGEWQIPLGGYKASSKEMLIDQGNDIYNSLDDRNFIKIRDEYYPVEFAKGNPDHGFIIHKNKPATIPVERMDNQSHKWRVVQGRPGKEHISSVPAIEWEHRLISASENLGLDVADPDVETGIVTIDGDKYIKGNYGLYKIEYNNEIGSYIIRTGDGLDYPVEYKKEDFCWRTKIFNTPQHRYDSGKVSKMDNAIKQGGVAREITRREVSPLLGYRVNQGETIEINNVKYFFEADGFTQLKLADFNKFIRIQRTVQDVQNYLISVQHLLGEPSYSGVKETLARHFGISTDEVTQNLIDEVKRNVQALQAGLMWLRKEDYSIMTLKSVPNQVGKYDGAYYPEINKITLFEVFFTLNRSKRLHILLHELSHARILDAKQPGMSTPDYFYIKDESNTMHYAEIGRGESRRAGYEDNGRVFIKKMKSNSLSEAWMKFSTNMKKRIKVLLANPDSVAGLIVELGNISIQRLPAGDR
jgi:putative heme iron utilization protein